MSFHACGAQNTAALQCPAPVSIPAPQCAAWVFDKCRARSSATTSSSTSALDRVRLNGSPFPLRTLAVAAQEPSSFHRAIWEERGTRGKREGATWVRALWCQWCRAPCLSGRVTPAGKALQHRRSRRGASAVCTACAGVARRRAQDSRPQAAPCRKQRTARWQRTERRRKPGNTRTSYSSTLTYCGPTGRAAIAARELHRKVASHARGHCAHSPPARPHQVA